MMRQLVALLFSDVAGYSRLSEPQLRAFVERVMPALSDLVEPARDGLVELNTWGDAIVIAHTDPYATARLALEMRDFYRNTNFADWSLPPDLSVRVALHAGVVFVGSDTLRNTDGIIGTSVNLAARIEPVTTPGQVWVTEQFMKLISLDNDATLAFDDLGERPLAKKFGSAGLFRLRRTHELPDDAPPDVQPETISGPQVPRELELAVHMARHGSNEQRLSALDVLDAFNTSESVMALLEVTRDKAAPHEARLMSLASLAKMRARAAVADLIDVAGDPDEVPDVVLSVIETLGDVRDPRALGVLETVVHGEGPWETSAVQAAVNAVAKIGDPKGIPILRAAFDKLDDFEASLANLVAATAILPHASFVEPLQRIVADRELHDTAVRGAAVAALMRNNPLSSEAFFVKVAADETEVLAIREQAVAALAVVATAATRRTLQQLASDLASPLAATALQVLVRGPAAVEEMMDEVVRNVTGR